MSHQEKENYINLVSSLLVSIPFFSYVFTRYLDSNLSSEEELKFWAIAILALIPLRIVTMIIMYILAAIAEAIVTGKEPDSKEIVDERDKIIGLKATRNSYYTFAFGFVQSLLFLATGSSIAHLFVSMIIFGFLAEMVEIATKIYLYRKGF